MGEGKATCSSRTVNMGKNKVTVKPRPVPCHDLDIYFLKTDFGVQLQTGQSTVIK